MYLTCGQQIRQEQPDLQVEALSSNWLHATMLFVQGSWEDIPHSLL